MNRLMTAVMVAEILQVSRHRVYCLIRRGLIKGIRIGRAVRIQEADLKAFLEKSSIDVG